MRTAIVGCLVAGFLATVPVAPSECSTADDKNKPEETKAVPRESIHVSNPEQGNRLPKDWKATDRETLHQIEAAAKRGPSNVFLVYGDDFRWAVEATFQAYNPYGTRGAEDILPAKNPDPPKDPPNPFLPKAKEPRRDVWVVAYLGSSDLRRWSIKSVELTGTWVRVSYTDHDRDPGGRVRPGDVAPYLMWARLGQLEPGKYTLELYETNDKEVNLTRLVKVK